MPQPSLRLSKGQNKSKPLTQRSHLDADLHMESRAIINILYRHRVMTEAGDQSEKVPISPETEAVGLAPWHMHVGLACGRIIIV